MIKNKNFRIGIMIAAALAASGCSVFKKGKASKTPVLGERVAVLTSEGDAEVDPATAALPMSLPPAVTNTGWTQSGGSPSKSLGQLSLGATLNRAFSVQAGAAPASLQGLRRRRSLRTGGCSRSTRWAPYVPSTPRAVRACGKPRCLRTRAGTRRSYGGGIAFDNGRIYATNGLGYVAAMDARNGGLIWKVRPGADHCVAPRASQATRST